MNLSTTVNSGIGVLSNTSGSIIETWTPQMAHIREGNYYHVTDYDSDVGQNSGDEKTWSITTPDTAARVYLGFSIESDNEALIELRENPTLCSGVGTSLFARNAERNSTNSSVFLFYKNTAVAYGTGTTLEYGKMGVTDKRNIGGSINAGTHKWNLKQNEDYAIVVTCANANTELALNIGYSEIPA